MSTVSTSARKLYPYLNSHTYFRLQELTRATRPQGVTGKRTGTAVVPARRQSKTGIVTCTGRIVIDPRRRFIMSLQGRNLAVVSRAAQMLAGVFCVANLFTHAAVCSPPTVTTGWWCSKRQQRLLWEQDLLSTGLGLVHFCTSTDQCN